MSGSRAASCKGVLRGQRAPSPFLPLHVTLGLLASSLLGIAKKLSQAILLLHEQSTSENLCPNVVKVRRGDTFPSNHQRPTLNPVRRCRRLSYACVTL